MKKNALLSVLLLLMMFFSLVSCNTVDKEGLWENATYRRDVELGKGEKTFLLEVKAGEDSVTFTVHTDKENLADALLEHKLVEGENGAYGLYIKTVNGIRADYDLDGHYWGLYSNGEMLMSGASDTVITNNAHYELVYC